jgi:hypothetical protein
MSGETRHVTVELAVLARTSGGPFNHRPHDVTPCSTCCQLHYILFEDLITLDFYLLLLRACYDQQGEHQCNLPCTACACAPVCVS